MPGNPYFPLGKIGFATQKTENCGFRQLRPDYNFWSSTENYNNSSNAWNVNLNNGNTNNNDKSNGNYVRCVRRKLDFLAEEKS